MDLDPICSLAEATRSRMAGRNFMFARIYRPAKTATQSGVAKTRKWVLEFAPESRPSLDPLMGWTGSSDMRSQIRLTFDERDAAERYARENGIAYRIEEPRSRQHIIRERGYGSNFSHDRREGWTH